MVHEEKTLSSRIIFKGKVVTLRVDTVQAVGGEAIREIVMHPGGACIVAVTPEDKILFVRQYRKAFEREVLELPAGKLEEGEDPETTILREVREETGYAVEKVKKLTSFYPSPGMLDEVGTIYYGRTGEKGATDFDVDEDLELVELSLEEALDRIDSNEIIDAKTIIGVLLYHRMMNVG